ncbi:hypothetical protein MC7420_4337 [Coleofasciculus chthonoplastes PCC 7420]|uniref:DUF541 domain-containing protein n=2 Tax=Coleofasciculus chthonoplastes TaxID=64178 RepID=B4W3Y0_9CYAN|nr:hypothetical protein MC7420_4337 [Coleofasciculus chthonoplastes PCC 7420]
MKKRVMSSLVVAVITTSFIPNPGNTETISNDSTPDARQISQLFYPPPSEEPTFRVIGKGRASQPADKASLLFKFARNYPSPPEGVLSQFEPSEEAITLEMLQPILDALQAIGVSDQAIDLEILEPSGSFLPFPFPSTATEGGAQLVVTVDNPNRDRLEEIVNTATDAASPIEEILISTVNVEYAVNNCQALVQAAYQSAVEDAQNRANSLAAAMGTQLRLVPSVAEPFYEVFLPGCDSEGNLPFGNTTSSVYDPDNPVEVTVNKDIFVTYTGR